MEKSEKAKLPWFGSVAAAVCCIKLLFFAAYRSTDFEVHRNWLAITHSLPVSRWYHENTSEWTLDYPPFFAWFEYLLSHPAALFDKKMLIVKNLDYASPETVLFQRLTVVITDLVLIYGVYRLSLLMHNNKRKDLNLIQERSFVFCVVTLFSFGLLIVDHIHFQYNGFLFGTLLLSIANVFEGRPFHSAFLFAALLNLKHIFLYVAPAYFIYLLRETCFKKDNSQHNGLSRLLGVKIHNFQPVKFGLLGFIVISVFSVSLGPFIYMGDLLQVFRRLFPVKRGLCHAYWAPNSWALYNIVDKLVVFLGKRVGLSTLPLKSASMTGGLVEQQEHIALPSITPLVTVIVTVTSMLPMLIRCWYKPTGPKGFIRCLILCAYSSFLFGYHVHEKAILLVLIPLGILAVSSREDARVFLLVSTAGNFALFPLLHQSAETPLKVTLFFGYTLFVVKALERLHGAKDKSLGLPFLRTFESLFIYGLAVLYIYCEFLHSLFGLNVKFPFIPLLLTSVYCASGILWSWLVFYSISIKI